MSFSFDVEVNAGTGDDVVTLRGDGTTEVDGGDGNDDLNTFISHDFIEGGEGDDVLEGSFASDTLTGGDGADTVTYENSIDPVFVTIGTGANDGQTGERDFVAGDVENVVGGVDGDTLVGDGAANRLAGGPGEDKLHGAGGADVLDGGPGPRLDVLDGGPGVDTADYSARSDALALSIGDGGNDGADVGGGPGSEGDDIQATVEAVIGGSGSDVISGDAAANGLFGGDGDDLLDGGDGADLLEGGGDEDRMFGGDDVDTVTYAARTAAVIVTVGTGVNDGVANERDYVGSDTENVVGGSAGDSLTGNGSANRLDGGPGNDTINGRGGPDVMVGGTGGGDVVTYQSHTNNVLADIDGASDDGAGPEGDTIDMSVESLTGGPGNDVLIGSAAVNTLRGLGGNDDLFGRGGNDTLEGGPNADQMDGEGGIDTATYAGRSDGITVFLDDDLFNDGGTGDVASGGGAFRDYVATENVIGGGAGDALHGDGNGNVLTGGPGKDTLDGLGGDDLLRAKDRAADTAIDCGTGADRAELDSTDPATIGCETVIF
jgi:Ca2+-binding RTX toxin-like protein